MRGVALRPSRKLRAGAVAVIPTPGVADAAGLTATYDRAAATLTGRRMISDMNSAASLVDAFSVGLAQARGLDVFPQISHSSTDINAMHLRASVWPGEVRTVVTTFKPQWLNAAVEYTDLPGWFARNRAVVLQAIDYARAAHPFKWGMSISYEGAIRNGTLQRDVDECIAAGVDAIMVTTYPQAEVLDPAGGPTPVTDGRAAVSRAYYDALFRAVRGRAPVIFAEAGWHVRNATGLADQAKFVSVVLDMVRDGTLELANWFFMEDANAYWPLSYFFDMGLYDAAGTARPAAALFNSVARIRPGYAQ